MVAMRGVERGAWFPHRSRVMPDPTKRMLVINDTKEVLELFRDILAERWAWT